MFTISGEELPVLAKKNVFVNIGNFHSREEFILLRMVEDCILGSNFFRKRAAQLDFSTGELWIPGQDTLAIQKESTVKEVSALAIRSQEQVPPHLQELFSRCSEALDEEQRLKFLSLLQEYQDIFASTSDQVGRCDLVRHPINTEGHQSIKQAPRRVPLHRRTEIHKFVRQRMHLCSDRMKSWYDQFPSYQENKFGCFIQDARKENDRNCNLIGKVLIWLRNA